MRVILIFSLALLTICSTEAQIHMPAIFGDHMVIQRSQPIPVWGWSSPGEKIIVYFDHQNKEAIADKTGKWRLDLDAEPAGGPYDMIVQGRDKTIFHDVLVGEVWLCSGQSNMEFELSKANRAESEINSATYSEIRQIKIPIAVSGTPKDDIKSSPWTICTTTSAGSFTAVGYFFARELVRHLHVPVGLINSTWGGTMIESWISRSAFEKSPEFKTMITPMVEKDFENLAKQKRKTLETQVKVLEKNISDTIPESEWKNPDYNSKGWPNISVEQSWEGQGMGLGDLDGIVWYRKEFVLDSSNAGKAASVKLGKIDDNDVTYINGIRIGSTKNYSEERNYPVPSGVLKAGQNIIAVRIEDTGGGGGFYGDSTLLRLSWENGTIALGGDWHFRVAQITTNNGGFGPNEYPTLLFNAMIHPLIPYGIRGVLWYQGEANTNRAYQYRTAFPLMISDWRQQWNEGNFPFYFVQLASFNASNGDSEHGSEWAELREAQTFTLSVPATGMSVTTDIGEPHDIHPKNKQDVGLRLSAIALNNIYALPMEYSGPVYESMSIHSNKIILTFTHNGSGLMTKDKYGYVKGFEIAGPDHHFLYAKAYIENNKVIVFNDEIGQPVSVHYAWADDAGDANLFNQQGFPAVPFRTDQWQGVTDNKKYIIGN